MITCNEISAKKDLGSKTGARLLNRQLWQIQELCDVQSFEAKYKTNYQDFVVEEIDLDHRIVQDEPYDETEAIPDDPEDDNQSNIDENMTENFKLEDQIIKGLEEVAAKKLKFFEFDTSTDKAERRLIHKTIKNKFPDLGTETIDIDDAKKIIRAFPNKSTERTSKYRGIWKFVMKKTQISTQKAINDLSSLLKRNPNCFSTAGNKDSFAITTQNVTSYGIRIKDLFRIRNSIKNISLSGFQRQNEILRIGQLYGNKFTLILRDIEYPSSKIESIIKFISEFGFINYFGVQRFGSYKYSTDEIGIAYMTGQYKKCIEYILENQLNHVCTEKSVEGLLEDCEKFISLIRSHQRRFTTEVFILKHLIKHKNDYQGAYMKIPYNERKLHMHSVQSLIWNNMASKYLEKTFLNFIPNSSYDAKIEKLESLRNKTLPIIGSQTVYYDEELLDEVLKELDIDKDIYLMSLKRLKFPGAKRQLFAFPEDFKYDFINCHVLKVEFQLRSSVYATELLRELTGGSLVQGTFTQ